MRGAVGILVLGLVVGVATHVAYYRLRLPPPASLDGELAWRQHDGGRVIRQKHRHQRADQIDDEKETPLRTARGLHRLPLRTCAERPGAQQAQPA